MKKKIFAILTIIGLLTMSMTVMAQTVSFNITMGGSSPDLISKRAEKNPYDQDNYFYVTGYSSSDSSTLIIAKSKHLYKPNQYYTPYGTMIIVGATQSAAYNTTVPHGELYYMEGEYLNGYGPRVQLTGAYTP